MKRILVTLPLLALAFMAFTGPLAGGARAAEANLVVKVGAGEPGFAINQFMPNTISVTTGSTITFEFNWGEPHSVTFGAPGAPATSPATFDGGALNTNLVFGPGPKFDVKFTKKGSYAYYCIIHPKMTATVNVVDPAGPGVPDTQLSADRRASAELTSANLAVKEVARVLNAAPVAVTRQANGSSVYTLIAGGITNTGHDAMQFFPAAAKIKVGDSIKWLSPTETPHTITFNAPPGPPQGDPINLPVVKPAGAWDGTGVLSSGTIWTIPAPGTRNSFEATFGKAGTYTYVCLLHAPQAMVGSVSVEAATAPLPPNTGGGTLSGGRTNSTLFGVLGLLAIVLGGGAITAARRKA